MSPRSTSIRLSPKHGVNPMVTHCFYCNEATGVALLGKLKGDVEAPRAGVLDHEPCDTCAGYMEQGVILISVREGEPVDNPYRTGGWAVVTVEAVERWFDADTAGRLVSRRVVFVPDAVWTALGLPDLPKAG
jgi:hypothetical protein